MKNELRMSTFLNREELYHICNNLCDLNEDELYDEIKDYLDVFDHSNQFSSFQGSYIMNLHGVNKKKLIDLSKEYNLFTDE